LSSQTERL